MHFLFLGMERTCPNFQGFVTKVMGNHDTNVPGFVQMSLELSFMSDKGIVCRLMECRGDDSDSASNMGSLAEINHRLMSSDCSGPNSSHLVSGDMCGLVSHYVLMSQTLVFNRHMSVTLCSLVLPETTVMFLHNIDDYSKRKWWIWRTTYQPMGSLLRTVLTAYPAKRYMH